MQLCFHDATGEYKNSSCFSRFRVQLNNNSDNRPSNYNNDNDDNDNDNIDGNNNCIKKVTIIILIIMVIKYCFVFHSNLIMQNTQ